jgi:hypothetical protein
VVEGCRLVVEAWGRGQRHCRWLLEGAGGRAVVLQMGGQAGWRKAGGGAAEVCWSGQAEGGDLGEKTEAVGGGKRIGLDCENLWERRGM